MHLLYRVSVNFYFILTGRLQCSSYERLNTCQQLVADSAAAVHWYKLECFNNYFSSCRASWCHYITSCLGQTSKWEHLCKWAFRWYYYFKITAAAGRGNPSPVKIHVKSCYQNYQFYHDRIYILRVTEYKSGSGNVKNGLYALLFYRQTESLTVFH